MSEDAASASNLRRNQKSCTDNSRLNISSRRIGAALLGEHPPTGIPVSNISSDHFLFLYPALTPDLCGYPHPSTEDDHQTKSALTNPQYVIHVLARYPARMAASLYGCRGSSYQPGNMSQPHIITSKENFTVRSRTATAGTYSYVTLIPLSLTLMRLFYAFKSLSRGV